MGGTHQKTGPDDGAGNKGVAELNRDTRHEHKEVRHGLAGDGQGLSEEDESRINESAIDANEDQFGEEATLSHQAGLWKQQLSAPIVRWERFLPLRTLNVLLVENDDSTRQVVCALLRNCSYEVTAASNGMEAWKVLEDLTNHIDLVLTEVVMPYLSGIGLLCKIMSHKTCKNIPVIMMSSNDAMGIVFKCLSNGAADFLVKPIRKNELKNLWQHVWRRCHSSSGSGSESGIQNQKSTKSKNEDDSDNNSGSNDEEDNGSFGLNARDGSDNGSGTQNSWTKRAVEVDSPQPMSSSEQFAGTHDSTCAQVIYPKPETFCSKKVKVNADINSNGEGKVSDDIIGKNLEISPLRNTRNESYRADKVPTKLTGPSIEKLPESGPNNVEIVGRINSNALQEPSTEAIDLLGGIVKNNPPPIGGMPDSSKAFTKNVENKEKEGYVELPFLELSLKRLRSTGEVGMSTGDERNVLKRSNLSAFSRYPTSVTSVRAPTGYGGSSVLDNSSVAAPLKQGSNGSSNNNDMGSTNKNVVNKPGAYKGISTSAIKCSYNASAFHPVPPQSSTIHQVVQEKINEAAKVSVIGQSRDSPNQVQVQLHHHHYHHHHHHVHGFQAQPDEDLSLENLKATAAYCSSSNAFARPPEANAPNYSLHGSNSGSNHGSDGQNGCSMAVNTKGTNMDSATGVPLINGVAVGNESGSGSGTGADQNRFAQREAALNKFRQKRKTRNFGKKVRYQSRKRLAEQRPRVRGQFVRRVIQNNDNPGTSNRQEVLD